MEQAIFSQYTTKASPPHMSAGYFFTGTSKISNQNYFFKEMSFAWAIEDG
jgi:hypothetical protein